MRCGEDKNAIFDANGKLESIFIFLNYIYNLFVFFFMNVCDFYMLLQIGGTGIIKLLDFLCYSSEYC
ncbi:hypothetical protein BFS16_10680 [Hoylesella timonensis]|uniref:Uncharacterized protein n=1 Tax=Hoylesella timonensis TaxID=386414 RepID=A0A2K0XDI2_9BACT|nr:hypothetical protein BFS16_10680 [Hoylesella timonensis]